MAETSTTSTNALTALDVIRAVGELSLTLPRADIQIHWHGCDETALRTIMAAFPDANWLPQNNGGTEWLTGRAGMVRLIAFATDPEPRPTPRLVGLVGEVTA